MEVTTKAKHTAFQFLTGLAIGLGVCLFVFLALAYYYVTGMTTPHVNQSEGFIEPNQLPEPISISGTLPANASRVRYCNVSVGLAGRLSLYRFSAPVEELHEHALNEFASHLEEIEPIVEQGVPSPINADLIVSYSKGFGVEPTWMLPASDSAGALYYDPEGSSHRPTIYIDEGNEVLYFFMTD